ncbi:hypothetical protein VTN00DRAFT_9182 [Thermoascus crustaceus]|uniref:uncharacterized protein n=1 Tax=Thermoascus crustaceus TaxID=5088 RepID=UPI0037439773
MRWKTRRWSRVASRNESNVIFTVALDVKLLFLDYLDHKAIRNTIAALGWEIPDSYWRSRFPKDLIFEVEEIGTREIDWQYLFLKIESLLKNSDALLNRRRIMKVLEGTKKIFLQLTEGEQIEGTI